MMRAIFKIFILSLCIIANTHLSYAQTAALLPNASQQFLDQNGNPLSGGSVGFYIPNTTTTKTVWQDDSQATPWTNPITLNAGGWAPGNKGIYGNGTYRQIVRDKNNNIIWDQPTAAVGGSGAGTAVGDGNSVGTVLLWAGIVAPNQYQFAYGQALSRTTYAALYQALNIQTSVTCTGGSATITGISDTTSIPIGATLEASCVPASSTVSSKTSSSVTLNNNATISTTVVGMFFPYGNGDGATTFNVPDYRGKVPVGRTNMGGVVSSNLTSTYYGADPTGVGSNGGSQSHTLNTNEMPAHYHGVVLTDPGHAHSFSALQNGASGLASGGTGSPFGTSLGVTSTTTTGITVSSPNGSNTTYSMGGGGAHAIVQPSITLNYIIKVTPDASVSGLFGVASIGGMQGVIACGTGVSCAGNNISVSLSSITSDLINYTPPFTGGVLETQTNYNKQRISVKDFGAKCDGVTDDTAAIGVADTAAAAAGKSLLFPGGTCKVSSPIVPSSGCHWIGDSYQATVLRTTSATGNVLNVSNSYCTFEYLQFASSVARTAGAYLNITGSNIELSNVLMASASTGMNINSAGGYNITLLNVTCSAVANGVCFDISTCTNCIWSQVTTGPAAFLLVNAPFSGIVMRNVGDLHCYDCNLLGALHDLYMIPGTGQAIGSIKFIGGYIDSAWNDALTMAPSGSGNISKIHFVNTWFVTQASSSIGINMAPGGTSVIDTVTCTACEVFTANTTGTYGVAITQAAGTTIKNIQFNGGCISNAGIGLSISGATSVYVNDVIFGCQPGNNLIDVNLWASTIGDLRMHDNVFRAATPINNGATITSCNWHDNEGYNNLSTMTAITVGASPFTYTAGCAPETVYMSAGTVSNVASNGTTVFASTGNTIQLQPHGTEAVTYTVAPTMVKRIN